MNIEHGYMTIHEWDERAEISTTLISLLREVDEISLDSEDILHDEVDIDALDTLFSEPTEGVSFTCEFQGCKILLKGDGQILVHPPVPRRT